LSRTIKHNAIFLSWNIGTIGVQEGILLGGRKKFALKMNNLAWN